MPPTRDDRRQAAAPLRGTATGWPRRAHRLAQVALFATAFLLIVGMVLARFAPAAFMRLTALYTELPIAMVQWVLVSGTAYFLLDSLRLLLGQHWPAAARRRDGLLRAMLVLWLALILLLAVAVFWYPAQLAFGSAP